MINLFQEHTKFLKPLLKQEEYEQKTEIMKNLQKLLLLSLIKNHIPCGQE